MKRFWLLLLLLPVLGSAQDTAKVGSTKDGRQLVPTGQLLRPAGAMVSFAGRPIDLALSPDGNTVVVKESRGLVVVDRASWKIRQELPFPTGGGSMHGIVFSKDGSHVYATTAQNLLAEAAFTGE